MDRCNGIGYDLTQGRMEHEFTSIGELLEVPLSWVTSGLFSGWYLLKVTASGTPVMRLTVPSMWRPGQLVFEWQGFTGTWESTGPANGVLKSFLLELSFVFLGFPATLETGGILREQSGRVVAQMKSIVRQGKDPPDEIQIGGSRYTMAIRAGGRRNKPPKALVVQDHKGDDIVIGNWYEREIAVKRIVDDVEALVGLVWAFIIRNSD